MNRFGRGALAAVALAMAGRASAQSVDVAPAEPTAIAAAAASCAAALSGAGVDERRLAAAGWRRAVTDAGATPAQASLRIYVRGDVVLLLTPDAIKGVVDDCYLTARIASAQVYPRVVAAMRATFGDKPAKQDEAIVSWTVADRKTVQIMPTGRPSVPAVKITVVNLPKEK
ncbi:MAG: hypothetical protein JO013_07710 [Alphaproteobacteria bacterium]|nr:hypothetical protein [Alphaproteobacteria bacterium]